MCKLINISAILSMSNKAYDKIQSKMVHWYISAMLDINEKLHINNHPVQQNTEVSLIFKGINFLG